MTETTELQVADPATHLPPDPHPRHAIPVVPQSRMPLGEQILTFIGIVIPMTGVVAAIVLLWGRGFHWPELGILAGMYLLTAAGITVGYHRLFVHRSFETFMPIKFVFGVLGSMAFQGNLLKWAAMHRRHHQHSDKPDDIHSPHHSGSGIRGKVLGFWHSHLGWLFAAEPENLDRYVRDLNTSPTLRVTSRLFPLWAILGLVIPAGIGGLISGTWAGAGVGFLWGGLVRIFLVHHVTASVNSACHLWGRRPFKNDDQSRNNLVFGILALGEGWHNTHHAFPTSARHGLRWWEIDASYWIIRTLASFGLAWNVKVPSREAQQRAARR